MSLAILFTISILIYFYLKHKGRFPYKLTKHLYNDTLLLNILILWLVIGFFFSLDYSNQWGCIIMHQPIFGELNILFSSISLTLILLARFVWNKKIKTVVLILELLFWIAKLMIYKGGYAVGLAAFPQFKIVCYDIVALLLRLLVIRNITLQIRNFYISTITILIILVKILFFSTQRTIIWEYEESLERSKITLQKIQGNWSGLKVYNSTVFDTIISEEFDTTGKDLNIFELIELENKDTILNEIIIKESEPVSLHIDSNLLFFNLKDTNLNYLIVFNGEHSATLFELHGEIHDSIDYHKEIMAIFDTDSEILHNVKREDIYIRKIDNDSLVFDLGFLYMGNKYKLKKKKHQLTF